MYFHFQYFLATARLAWLFWNTLYTRHHEKYFKIDYVSDFLHSTTYPLCQLEAVQFLKMKKTRESDKKDKMINSARPYSRASKARHGIAELFLPAVLVLYCNTLSIYNILYTIKKLSIIITDIFSTSLTRYGYHIKTPV